MISNNVYAYCKEDICFIENYNKAIKDKTQVWDCHHRLEIDYNLSSKELKEKRLYFNRPASELLFLTHAEHAYLHRNGYKFSEETKKKCKESAKKRYEDLSERQKSSELAKKRYEDPKEHEKHRARMNTSEAKSNISAAQKKRYENPIERQKTRESAIGKNLNKRHMSNTVNHVFVKQEEVEYYLNLGYHFGMK